MTSCLGPACSDERVSIIACQQDLAVECYRRCAVEFCRNRDAPAFIDYFACFCIEAGQDARIAHQINIIAIEYWRWNIGRPIVVFSEYIRSPVDLAGSTGPNGHDHL